MTDPTMFPEHVLDRVKLAGGANLYGSSRIMTVNPGGPEAATDQIIDVTQEVPQRWVVTLSPIEAENGALDPQAILFARAYVQWGHGGVQHQALLDWPHLGGTFTIAASSVQVSARALPPPLAVIAGRATNTYPVFFKASAAPAVGGSSLNVLGPSHTVLTGDMGAQASSGFLPIPRFARAVLLHYLVSGAFLDTEPLLAIEFAGGSVPALTQQMRVQARDSAGAFYPGGGVPYASTPVAVPRWVNFFQVVNKDPNADALNSVAEFLLDLG